MGAPVTISTASVPAEHCVRPVQEEWPFLVSLLTAELSGSNNTFNYGPTTPAPDDQNKPWFKTDASGNPDRWYVYSGGQWLSKHPDAAGKVIMYEGTEGSIDTFDGGEAGTVTATTGPMWEKVSAANGRFPVGPGTIGSTTIAVGGTGGTGEHTLTLDEIPSHSHTITGRAYIATGNLTPVKPIIDDDYASVDLVVNTGTAGGQPDGTTKAVNTLPPYLGIWLIRKTARTHYRV